MADKKATKTEEKKPAAEDKKAEEEKIDRNFPDVQPGVTVRVHQKITELNPKGEEKQRIQVFEGIVIARKHGLGQNATVTVRKISNGVGVEKIFPLDLPTVTKIQPVKKAKTRRAKLYFIRGQHKKLKETYLKD